MHYHKYLGRTDINRLSIFVKTTCKSRSGTTNGLLFVISTAISLSSSCTSTDIFLITVSLFSDHSKARSVSSPDASKAVPVISLLFSDSHEYFFSEEVLLPHAIQLNANAPITSVISSFLMFCLPDYQRNLLSLTL